MWKRKQRKYLHVFFFNVYLAYELLDIFSVWLTINATASEEIIIINVQLNFLGSKTCHLASQIGHIIHMAVSRSVFRIHKLLNR